MYAQDLTAGVSLAKLLDEREFAFADDIVAHSCCHDFDTVALATCLSL